MGRAQNRSLVSRPLIWLKTPLKETSATKARLCRRVISYLTSWRVTVGDIAESCDIRTPSGNAKSSSRTTQETRTSYCFTRLLHISLTIDRSYWWRPACGLKTREGRILARVFKTRALQNVQQTVWAISVSHEPPKPTWNCKWVKRSGATPHWRLPTPITRWKQWTCRCWSWSSL